MGKLGAQFWISLAMMAASAVLIGSSLDWSLGTKLFPLVVGIPVFALSAGYAAAEAVGAWRANGEVPVARNSETRATLILFLWIGLLLAGIALVGHLIAVPAFVLVFMMWHREPPALAALMAAILAAFQYVVLDYALSIYFPPPLLPLPWH